MIQRQTQLNVADNSGAKRVMCVGIPGPNRRVASLGDVITAAVKLATTEGVVKKSEIVRAVIVRTKKEVRRQDGSYIRFDDNAVVLLDKNNNLRGSRVFGPVAKELKEEGFGKIASLAPEVL